MVRPPRRRPSYLMVGISLLAMAAFGAGTYWFLGTLKTNRISDKTSTPTTTQLTLPGTLYLSQGGTLYRLQGNSFTPIKTGATWVQPAPTADGNLIVVRREFNFSDLYLVDGNGNQIKQLTHNTSRNVACNLWAFYPEVSPDGKTVFMSSDAPDSNCASPDLAVWSWPVATGPGMRSQPGSEWSDPVAGAGGDVRPQPLASGGLLYSAFRHDEKGSTYSQVLLLSRRHGQPRELTRPEDNCGQATVSPDQRSVAMICVQKQVARLVMASFDGTALGSPQVLVDGSMAAAPTWSPDGTGLIYFAPPQGEVQGPFQLWYLEMPKAPATTEASPQAPPQPKQVTTNDSFDATSPPAWRS